MTHGKLTIAAICLLMTGFAGGFVLRPVIAPSKETPVAVVQPAPASDSGAARGTQYFIAHIDEARKIVAGCREGSVRGNECANAETAVVTVESKERFKRFRTGK